MGRKARNDQPSPSTIEVASGQRITLGNDLGQVSTSADGQRIQWEVSAWKKHILSDRFLLAQSRDDYFYKYDRQSGELLAVLTKLRVPNQAEIVQFQVSRDGRIGMLVRNHVEPELELWDLESQTPIRTINFGEENIFGTGADKGLVVFKLSPMVRR